MSTCTSGGITLPLSGSTRFSTLSATITALVPLRFAMAMVTAGRNSREPARTMRTYCEGSSPPSVTCGDVAHEYRLVVGHARHHVAHVVGGAQKLAGFQQVFAIGRVELAGRQAAVGKPERAGHLQRRKIVGRQLAFIQHDANLAPLPADQRDGRNVRHLLDRVVHLGRDLAQFEIAVAFARKRQRQNRHVVDGARLHQRRRGARRNQIEIGVQLLVQPHDALLFVLADVEAHDRHRHARGSTWSRCTPRRGSPTAVSPSAW